jgi:hypothetical protein
MVGFLTWLKLFFYLRNTKTFGPLFKMMEHMIADLSKFMIIWLIIIIMFACVGILMFGELKAFESIYPTLIMLFEASLGSWSMDIYVG